MCDVTEGDRQQARRNQKGRWPIPQREREHARAREEAGKEPDAARRAILDDRAAKAKERLGDANEGYAKAVEAEAYEIARKRCCAPQ